jgi:beta-mannosidase
MNNWAKQFLDGKWEMVIVDNEYIVEKSFSITNYNQFESSGFKSITAEVPGNFELDMYKAGLINDPYFGKNTLEMQNLENKHLWYARKFEYNGDLNDVYLYFEGIDTFADIYLNDHLIAVTDNMLIPHEIKAEGIKTCINELIVHIKPTCILARNFELYPSVSGMKYNTESLKVRKASHMFGWDITPRIVSGGIWRSVYLVNKPKDRIDDIFMYTTSINKSDCYGGLSFYFKVTTSKDSLKGYKLVANGVCKDSRFKCEHELWHTSGKANIYVGNAKLWWPSGMGEPNLYDTTVELYRGDELLDTYSLKTGIRKVELNRTSVTDSKGSGEFCFKINDEKLFVKGTNWVPVDAFHSQDRQRIPRILEMLSDIGCNAIRCWGGNVYEDESVYNYCDANGIIVWQDFAMGCAVYPQDKEFCDMIETEIKAIVGLLRNHTSIVLWAGDNECDYGYYWDALKLDPNSNVITRKVIPDTLRLVDPTRPYIPSSPYIDETAYKENGFTPEEHLWGPRDYYKSSYYSNSVAHFASEIGYHGCNSPKSIGKFISKDKLWPWQDNEEWLVHASSMEVSLQAPFAYRIKLMADQIKELFGYIPDNLEEFSLASQISQAEAFKFFIELFRSTKWRRTGIIWWNLIDGWPQFSDAVVDYYYTKKLAYHFIKQSQQHVCLMFAEPNSWHIGLVASNDTLKSIQVKYTVKDISSGEMVVSESFAQIDSNSSKQINNLRYSMGEKHFYLIEWEYDGIKGKNHYLAGTPPFDLNEYVKWLKEIGLFLTEGF